MLKYIAPIAALAGSVAVFALLQANQPAPDRRDIKARPITVFVETVRQENVPLDVVTQGEVRSRVAIDLISEVSGRVVSVSPEFMEGGAFEPGALLVQIDDTDYRLALSQAEARVATTQVNLTTVQADADVARQQLRGTSNPSDLALKKPQVAGAKAALKAAEAELEQARANLARTRVTLPFRGRVADTYVDLGQFVSAGTPLCSVFATDKVEVRLPITYEQLAALGLPIGFRAAPGEGLDVTLQANLAGASQRWQAQLLRLDASIDRETRSLYAIAETEDPYGSNASASGMPLAVGLYVTATIHGRVLKQAMQIPRRALRAGDTVYVVNDDQRLDIRDVTVTHSTPDVAIIAAGLRPGEQVITSTIRNPIPGMLLKADPVTAQASASTAATGNRG
ncbi:MAG: efflux RND transporter periplasmic adaptor subunit [Halieaceae bacterium]|jgi:RND family efflux transporter MFP subunit|nr:efflux RND transporter periplasmic adaptor subunit [Halieaceae bacterium]